MTATLANTIFPGDRLYTFNSLVEEIALMERHIRDGSWRECSCNSEKHLPLIAGLASEAYAFAETEKERAFMARLRDEARSLKERIQRGELFSEKAMDRVCAWARSMRHMIEARSWSRSMPKRSRREAEELLREIAAGAEAQFSAYTNLASLEADMADQVLTFLAEKYRVAKPELLIDDSCHDPTKAMHIGVRESDTKKPRPDLDKVIVCRGGANLRNLCHEFFHYLRHVKGQPQDETEVERKSMEEIVSRYSVSEKLLNHDAAKYTLEVNNMAVKGRDIGAIYGSQHVAKGLERGFVEVDTYMGAAGKPVAERPSTWLNMGLGIGLPIVAWAAKIKAPWDVVLISMGAHMSTKAWDYAEEALVPAAARPVVVRGIVPTWTAAETPGGAPEFYPPMYGQKAGTAPVITDHVRYSLVQ